MDVKIQPRFILTLIFFACFGLDESEVVYIIPSPNAPCHQKLCLTLSHFAADTSWLKSDSTLIFLVGTHNIDIEVSVSSISILSLVSNSSVEDYQIIICEQKASFKFDNIDYLLISGLKFVGCGSNRVVSVKQLTVENSIFQGQNNTGTALELNGTNAEIINASFVSNKVGSCLCIYTDISYLYLRIGGAIYASGYSNVTVLMSKFVGNSAEIGGAIASHESSFVNIINSTFVENRAIPANIDVQCSNVTLYGDHNFELLTKSMSQIWTKVVSIERRFCNGGAIAIFHSRLSINGSMFCNNTSDSGGAGALSIQDCSAANVYNSEFWNNTVNTIGPGFGGAIKVANMANATIENCTFYKSSANYGGVLDIWLSSVTISDCQFGDNSAILSGGAITMDQLSQLTVNGSQFTNNRAATGGALSAVRSKVALADSIFSNNQASGSGGAMYFLQSNVIFNGSCNLTDNFAVIGGAVYVSESQLNLLAEITVMLNEANDTGGGLYIYRTNLNCHQLSTTMVSDNWAHNSGGGIHATNSLITVYCNRRYMKTTIHFTNNTATKGGGIYLESASQLRVQKGDERYFNNNASIYFISNSADHGEAIYVVDETYFDVCARGSNTISNTTASTAECFIQVLSESATLDDVYHLVSIEITPARSTIVGGLLDRCTPDLHAEILQEPSIDIGIDGVTYLKLISNINDTDGISSSPVRLCFCRSDNQTEFPDCSYEPSSIQVKKGESFNVSLVAVDQVNHTVANVTIHSYLKHAESGLGEKGQLTHETKSVECTPLTFSIYSPNDSEQLTLYAEGPCRNVSRSQRRVDVKFSPCICPNGFQPKHTEEKRTSCVCVCDPRLNLYITDNDCNYLTESLSRNSNFWITLVKNNNSNTSGYLIYPHCPLDYCLPSYSNVQINLNVDNGADAQCAYNRSGILCGVCQPGLSLSLGSSHCINCSKAWYKEFVAIIIITLLAGIVLIALLMVLNLTVAVGTLNGLIFYANIIGANGITFFQTPSTKFLSIFISWLNLEVGFDICFFEGMDTYWKTWLQLAFPSYVIFLVVMVIIVSKHSMRFSRLIAKKNPVATLTTVILLSYTMFLRTIIATLSFAILDYPDGSHKWVWLSDATVEYLSGKHIALFIAAILILIVSIAYTCLLFFWQWLLHHQNKTVFKWVRSCLLYTSPSPRDATLSRMPSSA